MSKSIGLVKPEDVNMKDYLKSLWDTFSDSINGKIVTVKDKQSNKVYLFSCKDGDFKIMNVHEMNDSNDSVNINLLFNTVKNSPFSFILDITVNGETFMDIINSIKESNNAEES